MGSDHDRISHEGVARVSQMPSEANVVLIGQCKGCVEFSDDFAQQQEVIEIVRRIEKGSIETVFPLPPPSRASSTMA